MRIVAIDIRSRIRTQRISGSGFVFDPNEWLCSRKPIEPLNDMTVGAGSPRIKIPHSCLREKKIKEAA